MAEHEIVLNFDISDTGKVSAENKINEYLPVISNSINRYIARLNVNKFPHSAGGSGGDVDAIAFRSSRGIFCYKASGSGDTREAIIPNRVLAPCGTFQIGFITLTSTSSDGSPSDIAEAEDGSLILNDPARVVEYKASSMWSIPIPVQEGTYEGNQDDYNQPQTILEEWAAAVDKIEEAVAQIEETVRNYGDKQNRIVGTQDDQLVAMENGEVLPISGFILDCGGSPNE